MIHFASTVKTHLLELGCNILKIFFLNKIYRVRKSWRWSQQVPPKRCYLFNKLRDYQSFFTNWCTIGQY